MARKKSSKRKNEESINDKVDVLPPADKRVKLDLSDDEDIEGDGELKINQEYAKRFEHNKKREELHRLQEKVKNGEMDVDDDEDSSSEEEDEEGDLVDDEVDNQISDVLRALRSGDKRVLDSSYRFFEDPEEAVARKFGPNGEITKKEKPVYLKDYQREMLLRGGEAAFEQDERNNRLKPHVEEQEDSRRDLIKAMHEAVDLDSKDQQNEEEDGFSLHKKQVQRNIEPIDLPSPTKDEKGFLEAFLDKKAWIPTDNKESTVNMQEEDMDFEDRAEKFEQTYNFRFEDPDATGEVPGYARNVNTVRRDDLTTRQRRRELEKERKGSEKAEKEKEKSRLKRLKVNELMDRLKEIRKAADNETLTIEEADLNADFQQDEWDKKMKDVFGDDYYGKKDKCKPEFDDEGMEILSEEDDSYALSKNKNRKHDKKAAIKANKEDRKKIEEIVDAEFDVDAVEPKGTKFRYREISPESFGLSAADILFADDNELNDLIGLKKLAPYREKDKLRKDKKKYAKKRRLREWRKRTFGSEAGPSLDKWGK